MAPSHHLQWFWSPESKVCHCFHCFASICHEVMGLDSVILVLAVPCDFQNHLISLSRNWTWVTTLKAAALYHQGTSPLSLPEHSVTNFYTIPSGIALYHQETSPLSLPEHSVTNFYTMKVFMILLFSFSLFWPRKIVPMLTDFRALQRGVIQPLNICYTCHSVGD